MGKKMSADLTISGSRLTGRLRSEGYNNPMADTPVQVGKVVAIYVYARNVLFPNARKCVQYY